MKGLKETGLYLLISIFAVSGLLSIILLTPPKIGKLILGIILSAGLFGGFCLILLLINGFIKHSTTKGGYSFEDYLDGLYRAKRFDIVVPNV